MNEADQPSKSVTDVHVVYECRCPCGSLLAKQSIDGIELKCRRCKRVVFIPWETPSTWQTVTTRSPKGQSEQGEPGQKNGRPQ